MLLFYDPNSVMPGEEGVNTNLLNLGTRKERQQTRFIVEKPSTSEVTFKKRKLAETITNT